MNSLVSFHLCKLSDEALAFKVDSNTDFIFQNQKLPARHIPARPDEDYDLLVGELLVRFLRKNDLLKMKKVFQKSFFEDGVSKGDCLRACIETITQISLPVFHKISVYMKILEKHGWVVETDENIENLPFRKNRFNEYFISVGDSGRGCDHAVIVDENGALIHDPFPNGNGNINSKYIIVFHKQAKGLLEDVKEPSVTQKELESMYCQCGTSYDNLGFIALDDNRLGCPLCGKPF